MKPIVIGYGLLGSEIVKQTGWSYLSRDKDGIDFTLPSTYLHLIEDYDTVINCVAVTDTYGKNKEQYYSVNYKAVADLSDACVDLRKKLIHVSTDYVYARSKRMASENDLPLISENWYTYYKLLADEYIMLRNDSALVCRCSFKPNPFPYESAWIDQIGNFDYVDVIATIIVKLVTKKCSGVYNVGTDLKSIYELATKTKHTVTKSCKIDNAPYDISMDLQKLKSVITQ